MSSTLSGGAERVMVGAVGVEAAQGVAAVDDGERRDLKGSEVLGDVTGHRGVARREHRQPQVGREHGGIGNRHRDVGATVERDGRGQATQGGWPVDERTERPKRRARRTVGRQPRGDEDREHGVAIRPAPGG